jgi:hypothetical protein
MYPPTGTTTTNGKWTPLMNDRATQLILASLHHPPENSPVLSTP